MEGIKKLQSDRPQESAQY